MEQVKKKLASFLVGCASILSTLPSSALEQ
jgi:hypothetical protein